MGFSTSAAVAIMLIGFLLAAGVLFPTVFTAGSETGDAFAAQAEQTRDQMNTAVEIETIDYVDGSGDEDEELTLTVANEGTTTLDVTQTDLLVNGEFIDPIHYETTILDDTEEYESNVWYPGSELEIVVNDETVEDGTVSDLFDESEVERVKIATQHGISVSEDVE